MDDKIKKVIDDVCEKLDTHTGIIRFQVLNNLDLVLNGNKGPVDQKVLDNFVKGPIAKSTSQIRHCRARLLDVLREGKLPSEKES